MASRPSQVPREVSQFAEATRRYRAFVEKAAGLDLRARMNEARTHLLDLYARGAALPDLPAAEGGVASAKQVTRPGAWPGFGQYEHYWEYFDPYVDGDQVTGSLSDDVLDVYRDVVEGLALWDEAGSAGAAWHWRFTFETHWGDHAIDALRALHRACARVGQTSDA